MNAHIIARIECARRVLREAASWKRKGALVGAVGAAVVIGTVVGGIYRPFGHCDCTAVAAPRTDLRQAVSVATDPIATATAAPRDARANGSADGGHGWGPFRLVDW
jgi:hypothetical protein